MEGSGIVEGTSFAAGLLGAKLVFAPPRPLRSTNSRSGEDANGVINKFEGRKTRVYNKHSNATIVLEVNKIGHLISYLIPLMMEQGKPILKTLKKDFLL